MPKDRSIRRDNKRVFGGLRRRRNNPLVGFDVYRAEDSSYRTRWLGRKAWLITPDTTAFQGIAKGMRRKNQRDLIGG